MSSLASELEALERRGWTALAGADGAEFYDDLMAADGLMVFPGMVLDKAATVEAIASAPPWDEWQLHDLRVIGGTEAAVVTYRATARRGDDAPYEALMSTVYVPHDGRWQLLLHQQTPVAN